MKNLPPWVWDLLADLDEREDLHSDPATCLMPVLRNVPEDVMQTARVIREYRRATRPAGTLPSADEEVTA